MTTSPGADNVALFRIARGTLLDLIETRDEWARVSIPGGLPVWVSGTYVRREGERAIITGNRVRARAAPGAHSDNPVLGLLSQGDDLQFIQERDGWVRVLGPETVTAWIAMEDITRVTTQIQLEDAWLTQQAELLKQLRKRQ